MRRLPKYRLHKPSNQAVVTVDGKDLYLGLFGSPESRQRYDAIIASIDKSTKLPPAGANVTVAELVALYLEYCDREHSHRKHARASRYRQERTLTIVVKLYGDTVASAFGPRALKAVRQAMVNKKWTRKQVNYCVGIVRRCFTWGVSEELVPATIIAALGSVVALESGSPGVIDALPRLDVDWERVTKTLAELPSPVRDAVLIQWHTGARPSEVLAMRWKEIDRTGEVWIYRPAEHKCQWRGHGREILLGRSAMAVLSAYQGREVDQPLFRPADAIAERWGDSKPLPGRKPPRDSYSPESYGTAVRRACKRAGVVPWSPYQLRHAAATRFAVEYGQDVARILLGQKSIQSIQRYDHQALDKAMEAIKNAG